MPEPTMMGAIRHYDDKEQAGYIVGHDGMRYQFSVLDVCDTGLPKIDSLVEFIASGKNATRIMPVVLGMAKG